MIDILEGITDGKTTEVYGKLDDNDEVLTKPDNDIKEGDPVE